MVRGDLYGDEDEYEDADNAWDNCFAGGFCDPVTGEYSHDPDRED